ncbi:glycosyltransferase family 39 protein [Myxococcota bacterium]|nr:glycosyltransferase family 39 protein [Myxococcota bacterium]
MVPGASQLGFWEQTNQEKSTRLPLVRREVNRPVPTELTLLFQLESSESTQWPNLVQWIFRGSARLPLPKEMGARLPAIVFSIALLLLFPLFFARQASRRFAFLATLLLLGAPGFLLAGRSLSPDTLWIFFSALAILLGIRLFDTDSGSRPSTTAYLLFAAALSGSFLSRGLLLGVFYPAAAILAATLLTGTWREGYQKTLALALFLLAAISAIFIFRELSHGHGAYSTLLYAAPNPSSSTPSAKHAHALFTSHLVRIAFGAFPWSVLLLLAIPALIFNRRTYQSSYPQVYASLGWLITAIVVGSYYEMRVGDLLFPALFPAAHLAAWLIHERREILFTPLNSLVLAFSALLLLRDLLQYPQMLPEMVTYYELPSTHFKMGWPLVLVVLPLLFPLAAVIGRSLVSFPAAAGAWWKSLTRSSLIVYIITRILIPVTFLISLTGRIPLRRWGNSLHSAWSGLARRHPVTGLISFSHCLAVATLIFGVALSHFYLHKLSLENSTRYLFTSFDRLSAPGDLLGVHKLSSRAAPVYIGTSAVSLPTESDLARFMAEEGRRFVALPATNLGNFDFLMRARRIPYIMPVAPSPYYMLVSNRAGRGETDHSPLAPFISTTPIPMPFQTDTRFEDQIVLVGYSIPRKIHKGDTVHFRLLFKVVGNIKANYKIFLHLDPPYGTRITGDHKPVHGLLPTRYWSPGTYVLDTHDVKISKIGFPAGLYRIYAGLFIGRRMKITGGKNAGKNRAPLGTMEIHPPKFFSCGK